MRLSVNLIHFTKRKFLIAPILILYCLFANSLAQSREINGNLQERIDNYIENEYLPGSGISSLGLAVVQNDGELLYTMGYGMADIERKIPVGNQTQFLIASITKSFTAVVAVKLLNERFPEMGEAVLDTPIRVLLPDFDFTLNDRFRSEHATPRDLLAHKICIFRGDIVGFLADPFETEKDFVYYQRYNKEICGFRTKMEYNNEMYVYSGAMIGHLAGKRYEEAVQDLLNELEMDNSAFAKRSDDFSQMPNRAKPYYVKDGEPHAMNTTLFRRAVGVNAAAGLFVCPEDMAKYMRFHMNLGELNGKQIVPQRVMRWLRKPSIHLNWFGFKEDSSSDKIISDFGYGLGLYLSSYDGWEYVQHSGNFPPYNSLLSMYPAKNLSIFSAVNMAPVVIDRMVLHAAIFEIIEGESERNVAEKVGKVAEEINRKKEEENEINEEEMKDFLNKLEENRISLKNDNFTGYYGTGNLGEILISERFNENNNKMELYMEYGRWWTGWLEKVEGNGTVFKFNLDNDSRQDDYCHGAFGNVNFIAFEEDKLHIVKNYPGWSSWHMGTYKFGVRLRDLPNIPWNGDSC